MLSLFKGYSKDSFKLVFSTIVGCAFLSRCLEFTLILLHFDFLSLFQLLKIISSTLVLTPKYKNLNKPTTL